MKIRDMAFIALCVSIIAICSWISIPAAVPFTLQTMAVFLTVSILGGKRGTIAVAVYILLGAIGLPVFSGFKGGIGALLGSTGGYIIGFLGSALLMWAMEKFSDKALWRRGVSMVMGLIVCYAVGTAWFMVVYASNTGNVALLTVLNWCVIPFIIPDILKIAVALVLSARLKKLIPA